MRKSITLAAMVALLLGLLFVLPGAALEGQDQPLTPQSGSAVVEEEVQALAPALLQTLADKLGLSVDKLQQVLKETEDELVKQRLGGAVQTGRLTKAQAQRLERRLAQVEPQDLLRLMVRERVGRALQERVSPAPQVSESPQKRLPSQLQQPQVPSYLPPYYQPFPYNCVCYCNFPTPYFMPTPLQPQPMWPQQPWKFEQPTPEPQPELPAPEPQTPEEQ
jgi:hypothetical protein